MNWYYPRPLSPVTGSTMACLTDRKFRIDQLKQVQSSLADPPR
ncbi:MAG: hypothetical protein R2787_01520 [Saprospiraceae bacterium]